MKCLTGLFTLLIAATLTSAFDLRSLVEDLRSKDVDNRRSAANELADLGAEAKPAVPALIRAMKDADPFVRRFAARALGAIGPAKGSVGALATALNDKDARVVDAAARALGGMGKYGVKPLASIVSNKKLDGTTRRRAITSIKNIGADAREAVPALIEALKDRDMRTSAVQALGAIGPGAKPALEVLKTMMEDRRIRRDRTFSRSARTAMRAIERGKPKKRKKN